MGMTGPRVSGLEVARRSEPLGAPFVTALREVRELEVVEVCLLLDDGTVGRAAVAPAPQVTGETAASIETALLGPLAWAVLGFSLEGSEDLQRAAAEAIAGNTTAKCALDLAVHDALRSRWGVGLPVLLGASSRAVRTDVTISLGEPEAMASEALRRCDQGFEVLKLKVGPDPADDVSRVRAVAAATEGRAALRLDANQAWTLRQAQWVLGTLEREGLDLDLVEQPVQASDLRGLARVRAAVPWPVLADEAVRTAADVLRLVELEAADAVNVKLAKCGGLRPAADVVAVARAAGLGVVVGCMREPPSAVAAAVAFAAAAAPGTVHDLDAALFTGEGGALCDRPPFVEFPG
jgi:L-alanine-DL-glutamate epimerase-like enolase superfamily enzyme